MENRPRAKAKPAGHDTIDAIASSSKDARCDGARPRTLPVRILRDYWASDDAEVGSRIATGSVVELPLAEAKRAIEAGAAERADPLPEA